LGGGGGGWLGGSRNVNVIIGGTASSGKCPNQPLVSGASHTSQAGSLLGMGCLPT